MTHDTFSEIKQTYADFEIFQMLPETQLHMIFQHIESSRLGLKRLKLAVGLLIGFVVFWNFFVAGKWISGDTMDIIKILLGIFLVVCAGLAAHGFWTMNKGLKGAKRLFNEKIASLPLEQKGKLFDEMTDICQTEYQTTFQGLTYKERVTLMDIKLGLADTEK